MIFQEDYGGFVSIKCEKCGTINKKHKTYCKQYGDEYHFNPPITCTCGNIQKVVCKERNDNLSPPKTDDNNCIKCPSCGSIQISAGSKGFGLGKAVAGGILMGPVGLLGGLIGSKKVMVTCLNCGKQWKAGSV